MKIRKKFWKEKRFLRNHAEKFSIEKKVGQEDLRKKNICKVNEANRNRLKTFSTIFVSVNLEKKKQM